MTNFTIEMSEEVITVERGYLTVNFKKKSYTKAKTKRVLKKHSYKYIIKMKMLILEKVFNFL